MSRLDPCFRALRARGEKALIPFITAGDPDLAATEALVLALAEAGADAIELGVPFSDPLAEGPTIQRASARALASGTSLRRVIECVASLRKQLETPLILMGYTNNFLAMGAGPFSQAAARAGVDGLIVVDLPPEEGRAFYAEVKQAGIDPILLAAPTTEAKRLEMLARETRGFLYFVSLTGVTGARNALSATLEQELRAVRAISDVPVCVGFGVSTPEQARALAQHVDGVVVGSALIDRIERAASREVAVEEAARFVSELKAALR